MRDFEFHMENQCCTFSFVAWKRCTGLGLRPCFRQSYAIEDADRVLWFFGISL